MLNLSIPWWEFVIRAGVVYAFLLLALRLSGKRQIGQLAPFDFVLLLVLSNAVQNSMNGGDNSLVGGLLSAVTLLALNFFIAWLTYRNRKIARFIEGSPEVVIHNGHVFDAILARERITRKDLEVSLRQAGCLSAHDVHFAILETNGVITIKKKD